MSELAPGPFLTQCLRDLGADVQKIERPPHGDPARRMRPATHAVLNAGKSTRMVDARESNGRDEILSLATAADVFVEGARPGVMERLGLGYADLSAINPMLVYVSISGYGASGPLVTAPGHDLNYLATSGVLALSGGLDQSVQPGIGIPVADFASAMYALSSTLAALVQRHATGLGQHLDVSITDCMMHWVSPTAAHFDDLGLSGLAEQRDAVFNKPAYTSFATADGRWIAIAALEDHFWDNLVNSLELDVSDLGTRNLNDRIAVARVINARIAAIVSQWPAEDLLERLLDHDVPASIVVNPTDLHDTQQVVNRNLRETTDGVRRIRYPVLMRGMR
ncbi:CoA transferase [Aeromicrobium sp. YIM 150415]|nr:CoA transferase [Aeromicrobium sp. YIM 150415]